MHISNESLSPWANPQLKVLLEVLMTALAVEVGLETTFQKYPELQTDTATAAAVADPLPNEQGTGSIKHAGSEELEALRKLIEEHASAQEDLNRLLENEFSILSHKLPVECADTERESLRVLKLSARTAIDDAERTSDKSKIWESEMNACKSLLAWEHKLRIVCKN